MLRAPLNCSMLLLPQRLSGEQAACRSLNSHQPVLWAPALDDPLPWDQQACWTPGSTSQAPLQWHPQSSPESCSSGLNGPIHTQSEEPTALHPGSLRKAWTPNTGNFSAWFYPWPPSEVPILNPLLPETSQVCRVGGLELWVSECGSWGRNIRTHGKPGKDSFLHVRPADS